MLDSPRRLLRLWALFVGMHIRSLVSFRMDFLLGTVALLLLDLPLLVLFVVALRLVPDIRGWSLPEMLFLFSFATAAWAVADFFEGRARQLGTMIIDGSLDSFLLRPVSPMFLVLFSFVQVEAIPRFVVGLVGLIVASALLGGIGLGSWCLTAVLLSLSAVIITEVVFALSCLSFWCLAVRQVWLVALEASECCYYPVQVMPRAFAMALTYVVPLAFAGPLATEAVLSKDPRSVVYVLLAECLAIVAWGCAIAALWRNGCRRYESTGS